jgi:hypothetical protein
MWDWIQRSLQRQSDLQQGVDADLVRANRQKWKLFALLLGLTFAFFRIQALVEPSGLLHKVAVGITIVLFISAFLLGHWAYLERVFLDKPDPKEPPKLWKWRR